MERGPSVLKVLDVGQSILVGFRHGAQIDESDATMYCADLKRLMTKQARPQLLSILLRSTQFLRAYCESCFC